MPGIDDCVSRVELHIEANGLRDMDVIGRSDPFAILYMRSVEPGSNVYRGASGVNPELLSARTSSRNTSDVLAAGKSSKNAGDSLSSKNIGDMLSSRSSSKRNGDAFGKRPSSVNEAGFLSAVELGWVEVGRTETIQNSLDPKFATSFEVSYFFEKRQDVRIELYDRDAKSEALDRHDYLGSAEMTLAQV